MTGTKSRPPWHSAVAGCTAGATTVLALQPLDVIKTRLQVQDGVKGALPLYQGTLHAARSIIQEEGFLALYAGLTPAIVGAGVAWGVYFYVYNAAKNRYKEHLKMDLGEKLPPWLHLASAAEAGSIVCLVTNPFWVAKTRLQLQRRQFAEAASNVIRNGQAPYKGFLDCLVQIGRHEGLAGLYKGLLPSLLLVSQTWGGLSILLAPLGNHVRALNGNFRDGSQETPSHHPGQVSHGAIQFAAYEELKSLLVARRNQQQVTTARDQLHQASVIDLNTAEVTICGSLSKLVASVSTYPSQVIRARMQQRLSSTRSVRYTGIIHSIRQTLRREGIGGLYRGLVPNVLRVMPQSAITFVVYEAVMKALDRHPATSGRAAQ